MHLLDNLDRNQREALKAYWISIINAIHETQSKTPNSSIDDELFFLFGSENPDCVVLRWLRARKWQIPIAVEFLMDTLRWRQSWQLRKLISNGENALDPDECMSGKIYSMGKDKRNRPVTYVHANEHVKGQYPSEATEKLVILLMENARYFLEPTIEDGTVVIDMGNVTFQNLDYQHIKFMINAMQNYYPECLGLGLVVNAPWSFNFVWNIIKPWLDPVVVSKIHFIKNSEGLSEYINPDARPQRLGGTRKDFKYIPSTKEDQMIMDAIRKDKDGMTRSIQKHRDLGHQYLDLTLKWASAQNQNELDVCQQRQKATEQLSVAYRESVPYVATRNHYHRSGEIQDTVFDVIYDRIRTQDSETTHL